MHYVALKWELERALAAGYADQHCRCAATAEDDDNLCWELATDHLRLDFARVKLWVHNHRPGQQRQLPRRAELPRRRHHFDPQTAGDPVTAKRPQHQLHPAVRLIIHRVLHLQRVRVGPLRRLHQPLLAGVASSDPRRLVRAFAADRSPAELAKLPLGDIPNLRGLHPGAMQAGACWARAAASIRPTLLPSRLETSANVPSGETAWCAERRPDRPGERRQGDVPSEMNEFICGEMVMLYGLSSSLHRNDTPAAASGRTDRFAGPPSPLMNSTSVRKGSGVIFFDSLLQSD